MTFIQKLTILFFFTVNLLYAQEQNSHQKHTDVLKLFSEIEHNQKKYKKITLSNVELPFPTTDGGMELTGYYSKGKIQKLQSWIGLSYGISITNFYFRDNRLFFVWETFDSFIFDEDKSSFDYTRTERNFNGYYYFKNNHLTDYETTGHNRFEDDSLDPEKILIEEMTEYLNLLQNKL